MEGNYEKVCTLYKVRFGRERGTYGRCFVPLNIYGVIYQPL